MRFLIGLIVGAGVTLTAATSFGIQPQAVVDRATGLWQLLSEVVADARKADQTSTTGVAGLAKRSTDARLGKDPSRQFQTADDTSVPSPVEADGTTATIESAHANDPDPVAPSLHAERNSDEEIRETLAAPPAEIEPKPMPAIEPEPTVAATPRKMPTRAAQPMISAPEEQPTIAAHEQITADDAHDADADQTESVWTPFHSERSASGFANRLQQEIGRGFAVTRAGPARYQVVFAYADEHDREQILDQVEAITGYREP